MAEEQTNEHVRFSASLTGYLRAFDSNEREAWAIHYEKAPVRNDNGSTTHSLILPTLIVTSYLAEPEAIARKVADILNKHWDDQP